MRVNLTKTFCASFLESDNGSLNFQCLCRCGIDAPIVAATGYYVEVRGEEVKIDRDDDRRMMIKPG